MWCGAAQAAGWLPAEEVLQASSIPATTDQPAVAMTTRGDVSVAATLSGSGGQHAVFYRVRNAFTGYGSLALTGTDHPVLATDPDGRIWFSDYQGGSNPEVDVARSSPISPETFTDGASFAAQGSVTDLDLAARHDEGAVAFVDNGQVKLGRWTPAGGAVGPNPPLYDGAMNDADHARVTLDAAGNLVTAFTIGSQTNACRVVAVRIPAGALPRPMQDIGITGNGDTGCSFHSNGVELNDNVDLALGPSGRVMASWYQNGPLNATINEAVAAPGAAFGAAATIASDADSEPVTSNPPPQAHGLLGASDAMLHTYLVRSPTDGFDHAAQQYRSSAGAAGVVREFDIGNLPEALTGNAAGQAFGAWVGFGTTCRISGAFGTVGGGLGASQLIGACGGPNGADTSNPRVAVDPGGDAAVAWTAGGAVDLAVYDATPPEVTGVTVPSSATVGQPAGFSASARDALSPTHVDWEFDDGPGATGSSVDHRFASAGAHRVVAHVRDQAGNTSDVQRTVTVTDARGGGGGGAGGNAGGSGGGTTTGTGENGSGGGSGTTDPGQTDTGHTGTGTGNGTVGPAIILTGSKLRASRKGIVKLTFACPAATAGGCNGTATLALGAARAAASRRLATSAFTGAAGATTTAKLKLARSARKRLARKRKLAVLASVTARDGAGRETTSTHGYKLLAPRR